MKFKERKENTVNKLRKIRRSSDLEMVEKVLNLMSDLNRGIDLERSCSKWMLIRNSLGSDITDRELRMMISFYRGLERSRKSAKEGDRPVDKD